MGALARYVERKFGQPTRMVCNPVVAQCEITPTVLFLNNPDRLAVTVVNLGATAMYVAWDREVSATHGIYLAAGGGTLSLIADDDGELVGHELLGIAITAAVAIFTVAVEAE